MTPIKLKNRHNLINIIFTTILSSLISALWISQSEHLSLASLVASAGIFFLLGFWCSPVNPGLTFHDRSQRTIITSAIAISAGYLLFVALLKIFHVHDYGANLLLLAMGISILIVFYSNAALLLGNVLREINLANLTILLVIATISCAPLWLGTIPERQTGTLLIDSSINLSPVGFLASLTDYDFLRNQWFYQYSVYGGLRFEYPSKTLSFVIYLILTIGIITVNHKYNPPVK